MNARNAHEHAEALAATAYGALRTELIQALLTDPEMEVRAPGYSAGPYTGTDIVNDLICGDLELLPELLRIVARCARGELDHETHLRASALIAQCGAAHAQFHADDLEAELMAGV